MPCRRPARPVASASAANGISSATPSISRPRAKSPCSTAAGTTAPGSKRVMGYCTPEQTEAFLKAVPEFERHLVEDGILLFKYWLCCDQEQQEERFADRLNNPRRRWKLSPIDIESRTRYEAYTEARERMLAATHTPHGRPGPWSISTTSGRPPDPAPRPARPPAGHQAAVSRHPLAAARPRSAQGAVTGCSSRSPTYRLGRSAIAQRISLALHVSALAGGRRSCGHQD